MKKEEEGGEEEGRREGEEEGGGKRKKPCEDSSRVLQHIRDGGAREFGPGPAGSGREAGGLPGHGGLWHLWKCFEKQKVMDCDSCC